MDQPSRERRLHLFIAFFAGAVIAVSISAGSHWWRERHDLASFQDQPRQPVVRKEKVVETVVPTTDAVQQLRTGGYMLYFRHGNRQKWDSVIAFDIHELATGRDASRATYRDAVCLSAQGREEAVMIGQVLQLAKVPVGHVIASPVCRARETAQLAFGRIDAMPMGLVHTPVVNSENAAAFREDLRKVLAETLVKPGTNTVIAAHENTIIRHPDLFASGRQFLTANIVQEGGMYVIRRDADGKLHVVHKFQGLGELAAAGITLRVPGVSHPDK